MRCLLLASLCLSSSSLAAASTPGQIKTLYGALDPTSISQHLAFYELYPNTPEGSLSLNNAWRLLGGDRHFSQKQSLQGLSLLSETIQGLVALVNNSREEAIPTLSEPELEIVSRLASHLPNRKLKGYRAVSEEEILHLPPEEIDLLQALFLTEKDRAVEAWQRRRSYEAFVDLMALQVRARLPQNATPQDKIRTINNLIFNEMGFRFPPHSQHAKEIDLYTFLPSVLDGRRGVCLGVSILYICLAQRLDLPLEMITPPGHIYVRYRNGSTTINIETTARGVHVNDEVYLGIDTLALQQRTVKEVVGLAHFNQAAVYWHLGEHEKALEAYERAARYLPGDRLLTELRGYNLLFVGRTEEGENLLREAFAQPSPYWIKGINPGEDYLSGKVDAKGIQAIFETVDETRESVLKKRVELEEIVQRYPEFRAGLFALASTWLQLHREGEALEVLKRYHALDNEDPKAEYYLSMLYASRHDYPNAWKHFHQAQTILKKHKHAPKAIKELKLQLATNFPE